MSILDDFQDFSKQIASFGPAASAGFSFDDFTQQVAQSTKQEQRGENKALFSIGAGTLERNVTRGRGNVVAVSSARDVICLATSRNYVLRYNYGEEVEDMTSSFQCEIEIVKPFPDAKVMNIYLDPSAHHLLINMQHPQGYETHYAHSSWTKTKLLQKMRSVNITSVGWYRPTPPIREVGEEDLNLRYLKDPLAEQTTREVLVGGGPCSLYSLVVDQREKKEKSFKKVYDFKDSNIIICGVAQQQLQDGRMFAMITTNNSLYVLSGGPSLELLFAPYATGQAVLEAFWVLPMPSLGSSVLLGLGTDGWPKRFCWLVEHGVYHGKLNLSNLATNENSDFVENLHLWNMSRAPQGIGTPISLATTEYHFILMFSDSLLMVNRINGKCVQKLALSARSSKIQGEPVGLSTDSITGLVYLFTTDCLVDISSESEDKDVWKVYLEMQDFNNALNVCRTPEQKDEVLSTHAEQCLIAANNIKAAKLFAKMTGMQPTFEDISLRFIEMEDSDALQQYLQSKLEALGNEEKAQKTMVASWLTELYLDRINRALMEEEGEEDGNYEKCVAQLRNFLKEHVANLDVNTTVSLLGSYSRMDDLMHFAECRQDHETLLECLMQRRDVRKALGIMRLPSVSQEIIYKFAPELMAQSPSLAVDFWMSKQPPLDPRRLLPALVCFGEPDTSPDARMQALRYIEFSINALGCQDNALHNLAIILYSFDEDESKLVNFIRQSAQDSLGSLSFDSKYALRLVRERNKPKACVAILCVLGLYEDAVALALDVDISLAKSVVQSLDFQEESLKRKLWLAIARHVIQCFDKETDLDVEEEASTSSGINIVADTATHNEEEIDGSQEASIDRAMELLKDAGGLLRIEDILPFFPDFVTIDKFQEPIEQSLEEYNKQIQRLKFEMDEATEIADALRKDIQVLETRTATITYDQPCTRCKVALGDLSREKSLPMGGALQPFFAFPTELAYHGTCLCAEVMDLVGERKKSTILSLMNRLTSMSEGNEPLRSNGLIVSESVSSLQKQLESEVAMECPRNGEIIIRMIDKPFIDPVIDKDEIEGYAIDLNSIL